MELQAMRPDDWPAVRAIYQAGIATGDATFETAAPTPASPKTASTSPPTARAEGSAGPC